MVLLIHHPVSPFGRKIRALMGEKKMLFILKEEEPWKLSGDIYKLNPAGELPIFLDDGHVLSGNYAITEYLEEAGNPPQLVFGSAYQKAEIRRLTAWFDEKFYREVYRCVVHEKVHKRFSLGLAPDSRILKTGIGNLNFHMEYLEWLLEQRQNIASDELSLADITAAAHLSVIDYLGDVPWENFPCVKVWYSRIKSRPCFKDILKDNIRGILPAKHYMNLDF